MIKKINDIKLVFAIGNPEKDYIKTRHNVGIYFIKKILNSLSLVLTYEKKFECYKSNLTIQEKNIKFIVSDVYMNNSGDCLLKLMKYYKIKYDQILIVQDDMTLECAQFLVKLNGSSHGHNGIKDIEKRIDTKK